MVYSANLGYPRIGLNRDLKKAVEAFWKGNVTEKDLLHTASNIKKNNWLLQKDKHFDFIPSNDFSLYDQILDTISLLGAVPERYNFDGNKVDLATYFAMARGAQKDGVDVPAMEMTKWFDTNYHYIVPELHKDQQFKIASDKIFSEFKEALDLGVKTRPVLLGPVSFLLLSKMKDGSDRFALLDQLLPIYQEIFAKLAAEGAEWLQIDEPCLVTDIDDDAIAAYKKAYAFLADRNLKIQITTYFAALKQNTELALSLGGDALHVDLVRAPEQLDEILPHLPHETLLSLGLVDGRNIWINDFNNSIATVEKAVEFLGKERVIVSPSCSLLHSPIDLISEEKLDDEIKSWLAFAKQKLNEVRIIKSTVISGRDEFTAELDANQQALENRKVSERVNNQEVKDRLASITPDMLNRQNPFAARKTKQAQIIKLPLFPTTTIGSFPQTAEVRKARSDFKKGEISAEEYDVFLKAETDKCIKIQEEIGIDVLVHGEFERNDMVEYFGEQLDGYAFTQNGWVQSYGSRCVKPPVIFGDISRPKAMTVEWAEYAQSKTDLIMKGMLTGPVTILQWSFVRNDQPREITCKQIALAIRDEVADLEAAGIKIIQIDEAALREGLPIHRDEWNAYLKWAVESFRITASVAKDETQIHTHMCYSEFNDIISAIGDMDADVISIETSRSQMELLDAFVGYKYPNDIGPGVYDIHSPRVPSKEEMKSLLEKALQVLPKEQLWVNPDCGLKTRGWPEVKEALIKMVEATKELRSNGNKVKASA
jgi:5-methyltetrahydropteroyltriglutamate--homocysteine methyltransferase